MSSDKENILLYQLLNFLKKPTANELQPLSTAQKIHKTLLLLSWSFVVVLLIGLTLTVIISLSGFQGTNLIDSLLEEDNLLITIVLATIIAPALEETIFRLSLKPNTNYLALTLATLTILILSRIQQTIPLLILTATIPLFAALYAQTLRQTQAQTFITKVYTNHFRIIFYSSAILFGLVHMLNYTDIQSGGAILPLLIIPQTIIGIILGYTRLQYGFKYGILLHGLYNASLLIPALIATKYPQNTLAVSLIGFYFLIILCAGVFSLISQTIQLKKCSVS